MFDWRAGHLAFAFQDSPKALIELRNRLIFSRLQFVLCSKQESDAQCHQLDPHRTRRRRHGEYELRN